MRITQLRQDMFQIPVSVRQLSPPHAPHIVLRYHFTQDMAFGKPIVEGSIATEPAARYSLGQDGAEDSLADSGGKRIGILIVAYNAVTTLGKVLRRITPQVWKNVEEVVVFDDASQDS